MRIVKVPRFYSWKELRHLEIIVFTPELYMLAWEASCICLATRRGLRISMLIPYCHNEFANLICFELLTNIQAICAPLKEVSRWSSTEQPNLGCPNPYFP